MTKGQYLIAYAFSVVVALGLAALFAMAFPGWSSYVTGWMGGALAVPLTFIVAYAVGGQP